MDSDKAAVWVTNWDTERNGSSLTTRDGTSYLLANAFMLAYDYGQPHIFSGYYYAGVDDGAPGATRTSVPDMTCPTDGIETAGTWHCAQRWTAIRGMIGFRNAVAGTFTGTVAKGSAVALYAGATLAAILLPVTVGVTFMAIARRNGKAQSDNSGPNND